jgi:ribonuclease R
MIEGKREAEPATGMRRAMVAERESADRLIADYLADRISARFQARVSGLVRTGLFVRLTETGADGFVPAPSIGHEYFFYDEARQTLVGEDTGAAYQLGDPVEVRLVEAIPTAGALRFEMLSQGHRLAGQTRSPRVPPAQVSGRKQNAAAAAVDKQRWDLRALQRRRATSLEAKEQTCIT